MMRFLLPTTLLILFVACQGRELEMMDATFPMEMMNARFSFKQSAQNQTSRTIAGMTNAGNIFEGRNITDIIGVYDAQYGLGLIQVAQDNTAQIEGPGNETLANAGNVFEVDEVFGSDVHVDSYALYNDAQAQDTDSNAGNMVTVGDIVDSSVDTNQKAVGNTAFTVNGDANAGNLVVLGRQLLRFTDKK